MSTMPTHLFIGPDKSGSSWLYELLKAHPSVFVPAAKDLYYFDKFYSRGVSWYCRHFEGADEQIRFDISHDYLFSDDAAKRIKKDLPEVNLCVCLRDPVERSYSQFRYMAKLGLAKGDFVAALQSYPELVSNSRYASHLERYQDFLNAGRLKVFWFEDLQRDPKAFQQQWEQWLGIEHLTAYMASEPVRGASEARSLLITAMLKQVALLMRAARMETLLGKLKSNQYVDRILFKRSAAITMENSLKKAIFSEYFQSDVAKLEVLTDRNLDRWRP